MIVAVVAVLVLVGLGVLLYFFLADGDGADPQPSQTQAAGDESQSPSGEETEGDPTSSSAGEQLSPPNATDEYGIQLVGGDAAQDAPHVVIYEDFQCPACAARHAEYAEAIRSLAESGSVTFEYRFATFMQDDLGNSSSVDAALAATAADEVGKFEEMHDVIFANQSATGEGFTEQQLREEFPAEAGITGDDLATYQERLDSGAYEDFVEGSNEVFFDSGVGATPTFLVGDVPLEFTDPASAEVLIQPTPEDLQAAIMEVA